jgi:hypothetical protein
MFDDIFQPFAGDVLPDLGWWDPSHTPALSLFDHVVLNPSLVALSCAADPVVVVGEPAEDVELDGAAVSENRDSV